MSLNIKIFLWGGLLLPLVIAQPAFALSIGQAAKGVELYREKNFEKAQEQLLEASEAKPDDPKLSYNLGNSRYKLGNFGDALNDYSRSAEKESSPELQQKTLYNMGNSLFRMGNLKEAAAAYKKSLELNPNDIDAKFNLEFVREQLEKKKQEQQKQDQEQKDKKDSEKDKQDSKSGENESKQNDARDNPGDTSPDSQKPSPSDPQKQEDDASRQAEAPPKGMTQEEAEQRLSSLNEDIKKFQRKQALNMESLFNYQGNDW